jgi:fructokinase
MPEKIIIGGGVSNQRILFPIVRKYVQKFLNGYFPYSEFNEGIAVLKKQLGKEE